MEKRKTFLSRGVIAALIAVALLVVSYGSNQNFAKDKKPVGHKDKSVRIGYVDVTGKAQISDTLGIAADKGYLSKELKKIGVKAELIPFTGAGPAINEALVSKSLDIGFLGDVPAVIGKASGIDTELIVSGGSNNNAALLISSKSKVTSVKQLKGKRIATQKGSFMHRILVKMLKANGLSVNDIQFVNMTAQDSAAAFVAKSVDAIVVGGVVEAKLVLNKSAKILLDCSKNPEWIGSSAGVVRTEYAKDNPDTITAVIKALKEAKELSKTDSTAAIDQWVKAGNSKETYKFLYPNNDYRYDVELTKDFLDKIQDVEEFLKENDLIKNDVDVKKWSNSSFYK